MTDMQASITTNMGNTPRAMNEVRAGMDSIEASTKRATKAGKDYQAEVSKGLAHVGGKAKELSHALSRLGTPAGGVLHHVFGGADSEFARVAVAAGVAGVAIEAGRKVMEKIVEDTKQAVEWTMKYKEALEKVHGVEKDQADKGAGDADARRKLTAAGGEEAVKHAQGLAELGFVSEAEARAGTTDIYNRFKDPKKRDAALHAAQSAAYVGVPFDQAAKGIPTGMDLTKDAFRENQVARIYAQATGFRGDQRAHYRDAYANVSGSRYLDATDQGRGINAQISGIQQDRATERFATDRRADLSAAADPTSAAILGVHTEAQKQTDLLAKIASSLDQQAKDPNNNMFTRLAAAISGIFAEQKLYNFQKNQATALGLPTTNAGQSFGTNDANHDPYAAPGL